ncbi:MAG TPA: flagellar motor protein MotB [Terriglobia bacterium]|nr:flagellar motor protein MotB [Terriglobia bacterium]
MARKRKHPEHVNHERWLVSYADFITLLFAFFVVMFAASNSDQKKAGQIAQAVQTAFHDLAVFTPSGKVVPLYDQGGLPSNSQNVLGNAHSAFDKAQLVTPAGKPGDPGKLIREVKNQLELMLKDELAKNTIRITEDARGLTVSLAEAGFFGAGSATMNPGALAIVERIAATLRPLPYNLRIEGHTDNTPIHTAQFPSNWELSTSRATYLLQYMISTANISPERLSAVGYGEYRPVVSNETAEGRAANRRVDVVVLSSVAQQQLEPPQAAK